MCANRYMCICSDVLFWRDRATVAQIQSQYINLCALQVCNTSNFRKALMRIIQSTVRNQHAVQLSRAHLHDQASISLVRSHTIVGRKHPEAPHSAGAVLGQQSPRNAMNVRLKRSKSHGAINQLTANQDAHAFMSSSSGEDSMAGNSSSTTSQSGSSDSGSIRSMSESATPERESPESVDGKKSPQSSNEHTHTYTYAPSARGGSDKHEHGRSRVHSATPSGTSQTHARTHHRDQEGHAPVATRLINNDVSVSQADGLLHHHHHDHHDHHHHHDEHIGRHRLSQAPPTVAISSMPHQP